MATQSSELIRTLHRIARLRTRFRAVVPEELATAKKQSTILAGKAFDSAADYDLLFNIGILLSKQEAGATMGELSKGLDVPLSTATRIVDWLVNANLVTRVPDKADRRVVRVAWQPAGLALFQLANDHLRRRADTVLNCLEPDEQQQFLRLLSKVVDAMEIEAQKGDAL